ncbi:glycosyltransferase family 4 protein [Shimia sp. SDUM112013]|uniref:glycosyltransferase family 4 protein n=1 Tax=Shimia sp. SDUM112013 TaxID=3136160 RepID=UPI0032EF4B6E
MKIVMVCPYAMGRPGGVQTHVRDMAAWLRDQGHEVRIIAPDDGTDETGLIRLGGFRKITLHGTSFEVARASRKAVKAAASDLRTWGAEVMHLHTPWTPMMAWQIWREMRLPTVATFHATLPQSQGFDPMTAFLNRAAHYFSKRIPHIVVPSRAPQAQWEALGLPTPTILAPTIDLGPWRDARQGSEPGVQLVYLGRLEERKGLHVLLDAWPDIAAMLPRAMLTIAGSGELRDNIAARIKAESLSRVTCIAAPDNATARTLVGESDFFIAPALEGESFGLVLIEAMAAGTLPVAAANEGFRTVLTGGGQDLLVPPGDALMLAEKVVELVSNAEKRRALQHWADQRANDFDVVSVGPRYVELYRKAVR